MGDEMSDDTSPTTTIEERFCIGLKELIGMCAVGGMPLHAFVKPMKNQLLSIRQDIYGRKFEDDHDAKHGLPPRS